MKPLLALALVALLAGCGSAKKTATHSSQPTAASIAQQTAKKTAALKSFHFVYQVKSPPSGGGLVLHSADGDVALPGKLKANVSGTYMHIPLSSQVVFAGGKAYLKNPLSGSWQSFSTSASPTGYFDPSKGVFAVIKRSDALQLSGTTTVDGTTCWRLTGKLPAQDVAGFLITKPGSQRVPVELDVGTQDSLLRRIRIEGPVNPSEPKDVERVITLSRFDEPTSITAPAG